MLQFKTKRSPTSAAILNLAKWQKTFLNYYIIIIIIIYITNNGTLKKIKNKYIYIKIKKSMKYQSARVFFLRFLFTVSSIQLM